MEDFDFVNCSNERPLSLPLSFSNLSPTSPVAECCSCKHLSNSSGNIYQKRVEKRNLFSIGKKKSSPWTAGTKLTWSVFKSKSKSFVYDPTYFGNKNADQSSFIRDSNRNGNSRASSWTYSQSDAKEKSLHPKIKNQELELFQPKGDLSPKKNQQPVITPTYQTAYTIQSSLNPHYRSSLILKRTKQAASSEPHDLRKLLDKKTNPITKQRCFEKADIPRSPGPLDGSLYAQIKKKKKTAKTTLLLSSRAYHSAEEISYSRTMAKVEIERKNDDGVAGHNIDRARREISDVFALSASNKPSKNEVSRGKTVITSLTVENVEECGYHSIASVESQSIKEARLQPTACDDSKECNNVVNTREEKLLTRNLNDKASDKIKENDLITTKSSSTSAFASTDCDVTKVVYQEEKQLTINEIENSKSLAPFHGKTLEATSSAPFQKSNPDEMRRQVKKQLTKEEVQEAVALINECLSDQELRNGPFLPNVTQLNVNNVNQSELSKSSSFSIKPPNDAKAPAFSPTSPDYTSVEANRLFGDKSPEYALPVRDVIHKNVRTRAAEICLQENSFSSSTLPESQFDNLIDDMVATKIASEHSEAKPSRKTDNDISPSIKNRFSEPAQDSLQSDFARKNFSGSDVDSGIEGSALNTSVKTDLKTSVPEGNTAMIYTLQPDQTSENFSKKLSFYSIQTAPRDETENEKFESVKTILPQSTGSPCPNNLKFQDLTPEDEEERRVREEIENTQKRLAWLQEQQDKLKKQKEEKLKRHSMDLNPSRLYHTQSEKPSVWSSTLPRRPVNYAKSEVKQGHEAKLNVNQQKDVEDLLRSVQELNFTGSKSPPPKIFPNMASATLPNISQETAPIFKQNLSENGGIFTPAYAHPMHQPQHMQLHHYQLQNQEENRRKSMDSSCRLHQQELIMREEKKKAIALQEKKREEERARQEQFEIEFEQKQKQLLQEKRSPKSTSLPVNAPRTTKTQTVTRPTTSGSTKTLSMRQNTNVNSDVSVHSDELQSQLDELDHYIAILTKNINTNKPGNPAVQPATKSAAIVRRRRSFSIEIDRKMDPSIPLTPDEEQNITIKKATPPKPPSRTRSSFDSVSRRLSHGFELAQYMRQNPIDQDIQSPTKDDDVFMPQTIQPSYPPQTRHTRPIQQQIVVGSSTRAKVAPQKTSNTEDGLSPQLFIAMTMNPGARPAEDIHSYREDLDPSLSRLDVVDGAPLSTPNFPFSPATPYVNNLSTPSTISPAGLAKTPLSALGLKPVSNQNSIKSSKVQDKATNYSTHGGATKQQTLHSIGVTSSKEAPVVASVSKDNHSSNGKDLSARLENPTNSSLQSNEFTNKNISSENHHPGAKMSLITHRSQDSGFSDTNHHPQPSNGWAQQTQGFDKSQSTQTHTKETNLKSPWIHSGQPSSHYPSSGGKSLGPSFAYPSPQEESPSNALRSLSGSNDSLLSDGSSSSQPHFAYQQQRFTTSNVSFSQKDNSQRNSGSSIRSSSTGGSGYLGGTSRTSPHSAGSPASSAAGQYPLGQPSRRCESQLSAYDKQGIRQGHQTVSTDDGGLSSPTSDRTSSSSTSDIDRMTGEMSASSMSTSTPKFIRDTTSYWYKPDITREQALAMLRNRPPGSFLVRDSRCYPGAFGLAIKVHQVPAAILAAAKPGTNMNNELVRHFLIEPSSRGVKLKGCANEPVFGSLSALIYQHSITPLALPCPLLIPTENQEVPQIVSSGRSTEASNTAAELLRQGAACNVLYLTSVDTESLTGPDAIERSMRECIANKNQLKTSIVHFKVSPQGITLTDNARKIFFRRHYPTSSLTYCGLDPGHREPRNRRWDASSYRGPSSARVFGFVAKKPGSTVDNVCHLFAELDLDQPAPAVVSFVNKVLLGLS